MTAREFGHGANDLARQRSAIDFLKGADDADALDNDCRSLSGEIVRSMAKLAGSHRLSLEICVNLSTSRRPSILASRSLENDSAED
jgi:hypothetical protein